jgi:hypothetical protein
MSTPLNPLDIYQSYSYHHFLIAANNTEVLRRIEDDSISFSALSGLKHGESIAGQDGSVVMVLNSAVDSKFFIDSLSYTSYYVNVADSSAKLTTASEMDMVVRETGGATFINFLRDLSDVHLQTSYNSVCFMLKTFFVGHQTNGNTHTYQTKPITLLLGNMDSSFDYSGGVHTIKFYGMSNGAPFKNENLHYVNRNLNLVTNENSVLLKDLVDDLERKLNKQLEEQWTLVRKFEGNGRQVRYKFTIPKDWANYKVSSTSKDNYVERLFEKEEQAVAKQKSDAESKKAAQTQSGKPGIAEDRFKTNMNTAVRTTVTQILSEIFKHCDEIHAALVGNQNLPKDQLHDAKLHQVVSSITSDQNGIVVHFDIVNYYLPRLPDEKKKEAIQKVTEEELNGIKDKEFDKYGITFDYIFTGMNSDILSLDMKANHSNAILIANQTGIQKATGNMTATDSSVTAASKDQNQIKTEGKKVDITIPMRKYDAVYLPAATADAQQGYIYAAPKSAELRTKYVNMLAVFASTVTSNMHVVIRGNPMFMNQQIRPIFPHNDIEYQALIDTLAEEAFKKSKEPGGEYDSNETVSAMGKYTTYLPQFVRVNIKTPTFNEAGQVIGFEPFWYQGRYRVTSIKNHFQAGSFTQELFLLPYDLKGITT